MTSYLIQITATKGVVHLLFGCLSMLLTYVCQQLKYSDTTSSSEEDLSALKKKKKKTNTAQWCNIPQKGHRRFT